MKNYYILDRDIATPENELIALESCIGENYTQRYSLDFRKILLKTYNVLNFVGIEEKTEEEIHAIMQGLEWQDNDNLI